MRTLISLLLISLLVILTLVLSACDLTTTNPTPDVGKYGQMEAEATHTPLDRDLKISIEDQKVQPTPIHFFQVKTGVNIKLGGEIVMVTAVTYKIIYTVKGQYMLVFADATKDNSKILVLYQLGTNTLMLTFFRLQDQTYVAAAFEDYKP